MTTQELVEHLQEKFKDKIHGVSVPVSDMVMITVARNDAANVARYIFHDMAARFVVTVGTDGRETGNNYLLDYVFSLAADHLFLTVRQEIPEQDLWFNSVMADSKIPAVNWAEREVQDLLGIKVKNHPDPRKLILSDDWPEKLHPLRRDVKHDVNPPSHFENRVKMKDPPKGSSVVPIGPFFPVLEEPAYFRLFVEGETVVGGDYRGFYNHRGIEKIADSQLNYNQVPFLAERICGI